jgi:uroporphyrinogen decarboxylase
VADVFLFNAGIIPDWVWLREDMCYNKGSLVSPSFMKKYMAPRYRTNAHYPFKIASGMDPIKLRKKYGKNVVIIGGIDIRVLSKGKKEIDREIEKIKVLIKDGGYLVYCDHHILPDVQYDNIKYFFNDMYKLEGSEETRRIIQ